MLTDVNAILPAHSVNVSTELAILDVVFRCSRLLANHTINFDASSTSHSEERQVLTKHSPRHIGHQITTLHHSMDEDEDDFYGGGGGDEGMHDVEDAIRQQGRASREEQMDVSDEEEEDSDDVGYVPTRWLYTRIDTAM